MPSIDPVDTDSPGTPPLEREIAYYDAMGDSEGVFPRVLAHAPNYAEAITDAMARAHTQGAVDHRLKEIMRIGLARLAGDPYFSSLRSKQAMETGLTEERIEAGLADFENDPQFTDAERWALRYAHLMYRHPEQVDAAFYEEGKRHWSEAQIMEMGGMIAVHFGMQVFMRTLQPDGESAD